MAVYVAPSVFLRRDALNQAAEVFHEEGCRVVLGSVLKEQEEPFSRWLCEELERQNPKEFQQILQAEQKLSECTVKADEFRVFRVLG